MDAVSPSTASDESPLLKVLRMASTTDEEMLKSSKESVGTTTEDCTLIAPATMVLFCWWLQIMSSTLDETQCDALSLGENCKHATLK